LNRPLQRLVRSGRKASITTRSSADDIVLRLAAHVVDIRSYLVLVSHASVHFTHGRVSRLLGSP
jgi:hypothetical protein